MIRIIEIVDDLQQGATDPTLCRGEDGRQYVVKSEYAGRDSLVREWLAARIGTTLGLPVPQFAMVYFDREQARFAAHRDAAYLARCPGFASTYIADAIEYLPSAAGAIDPELIETLFWFDWWTGNGDRNFGNPNLLWRPGTAEVHVIDHNLAFSDPGDPNEFRDHHVFGSVCAGAGRAARRRLLPQFRRIIDGLELVWQELPDSWTEGATLSLATATDLLKRCDTERFWDLE